MTLIELPKLIFNLVSATITYVFLSGFIDLSNIWAIFSGAIVSFMSATIYTNSVFKD